MPSHRQEFPFPIATALRAGLRSYNLATFKSDLGAGLIVSLMALPLSMALSIAVGLPPEHGIYTAIVAGIIAALLGGSMTQVSGPTAAFVVIIAPVVSSYGLHGLIWCQIIAGVVLIALGTSRLGKLVSYVPYPVTTGFTAGIAVTIATLALNDFLGLGIDNLDGNYIDKVHSIATHLPSLEPADLAVGMVTLLGIVYFPKITTRIPAPVAGITLGLLAAQALAALGHPADTLLTRFSYTTADGGQAAGIPPFAPRLHLPGEGRLFAIPDWAEFKTLVMPAFVIAALAALESLLSATVADNLARTRHDPNAELNGIGIANIFSGLAAGIPATGAIARTAANIQAGGKTPVAAVIHALFILLYVLTLAPFISHTPMAALAALLLTVAWRMSHIQQCRMILRLAPRSDSVVMLTCFFLTVFIDMVAGITVGMIMASLLFMRRIAKLTNIDVQTSTTAPADEAPPDGVMIYRIEGPLFFGTITKTLEGTLFIEPHIRRLVIDLMHVPMIDMTGMMGMTAFLSSLSTHQDCEVVLCGRAPVTDKIVQKLRGTPAEGKITVRHRLNDAVYL